MRERTGGSKSLNFLWAGCCFLLPQACVGSTLVIGTPKTTTVGKSESRPEFALAGETLVTQSLQSTDQAGSLDVKLRSLTFFLCKEVDSGDSHSPLQTIHPAKLTWTVEIMVLKLMFLSNYWGCLVSMLVFWVFLYTFLQGSWLG